MKKNTIRISVLWILIFTSLTMVAQGGPIMGWSSWNAFRVNISDSLICHEADIMCSSGLAKAGYKYVNIDDGFFGGRDANGRLLFHPTRFPHGMKGVVDHIHGLGLKAGIYSDAGHSTCGSFYDKDSIALNVGLYGHEEEDCNLYFRQLGFDFIKVDFCGGIAKSSVDKVDLDCRDRYTTISKAIKSTGRKVVFNVCRWDFPGTWVHDIADSWRISHDIRNSWNSVKDIIRQNLYLSAYAYDGHYNDMDMLEVGRGLSMEEDKTHFGMWCIMSSPLLIGCDLSKLQPSTLRLLTNKELIALNQDPLHLQAACVGRDGAAYILVKDIKQRNGNERALAVYNPSGKNVSVKVQGSLLCLEGIEKVRDCFEQRDLPVDGDVLEISVPVHGCRIFTLKAHRRLEQTCYEAENGYCSEYQEISNEQSLKTPVYQEVAEAHNGAVVKGLGYRRSNDLQFRDIYVKKGGKRRLMVAYLKGEGRSVSVKVNDSAPQRLSIDSGNNGQVATTIVLRKGRNTITLYNDKEALPPIDYIKLEPVARP